MFDDTVPSVFELVDDSDDDGISVKQFTKSVKILCMIKQVHHPGRQADRD